MTEDSARRDATRPSVNPPDAGPPTTEIPDAAPFDADAPDEEAPDADTPGAEVPGAATTGGEGPGSGGRRRLPGFRWLVAAAVAVVVLVAAVVATIGYGVYRLDRASDDRAEAGTRVGSACDALERRLNRLVPPGAAQGPGERATAVRNENAAVEPLVAELDRLPERVRRYRTFESDWRELVAARERYARDLDTQATTARPAFFVLTRDAEGTDRVRRILRTGPSTCDAAARRLAAPDL